MKIAINCAFFQPKGGGIKEYIYNLVNNLSLCDTTNSYILYVLKDMYEYAKENFPQSMRIKVMPYASRPKSQVIKRSLFEQNFWTKEEQIEQFDIFHSPFFHSPSFKRAKVILTVHDMRFYRYPATYAFLRYIYLKYAVRHSIKKAHHIISISEFTKKEIIQAYHTPQDKITVIHESINQKRFSEVNAHDTKTPFMKELQSCRFLLSVGHIETRKKNERLIQCFNELKEKEYQDLKLVIVGKKGHSYKKFFKYLSQSPDVYYLDFVSHEMLIWLYKNTSLFVFPSFYEGFGFPPLEAAALGTVSAVSNVSSMPEVCGDSVFYFNPFSIESMKETITEALSNQFVYNEKKQKLASNLNRFSWKENAKQTLQVYYHIFNNSI